jgi:hypothetical protein
MVVLEFQRVYQMLQDDIDTGLDDEHISALLETYLELPVRFSVNNTELLETFALQDSILQVNASGNVEVSHENQGKPLSTPCLNLPLLSVAIVCFDSIRKACNGEKSIYSLPGGAGYLHFLKIDSKIRIFSTINKNSAEADCPELLEAFSVFAGKTRILAEELFPQLHMDASWKTWFE